MTLREFWRYHFLKTILALVFIQIAIFAWLQYRNHRPIAQADEVSVFEGRMTTIRPLRNDSDKDNDELTLRNVALPPHGTITTIMNSIEYTASRGFTGVDSFLYSISDGKKESREAYIKVTVNENRKPAANTDYAQIYTGNEIAIPVTGNDEDRENDSIFIHEFTLPLHGQLQRKGTNFIYTSTANAVKADSFQYDLSDGFNISEKVTVYIELKDKNDPNYPWLSSDVGNTAQRGSISCINKTMVIKGSGTDIWAETDGFHFAYEFVNGVAKSIQELNVLIIPILGQKQELWFENR